jgi:outer membrane biosynthesis protein TonB
MGATTCKQCVGEDKQPVESATVEPVASPILTSDTAVPPSEEPPPKVEQEPVKEEPAPAPAPTPAPTTEEPPAKEPEPTASKEYTASIDRSTGGALGVHVDWKKNGSDEDAVTLNVVGIQEKGLVPAWNKTAAEGQRIEKGTRILRVNDVSGTPADMIAEIRKQQAMNLVCKNP